MMEGGTMVVPSIFAFMVQSTTNDEPMPSAAGMDSSWLVALVIGALVAGCTSQSAPLPATSSTPRRDTDLSSIRLAAGVSRSMGEVARIEGLAENVEGRACVLLDHPESRIVVEGLTAWPADVLGGGVAVNGRLTRVDSVWDEEAGISPWVVSKPSWEPLPADGPMIVNGMQLAAADGTHVVVEGLATKTREAAVSLVGEIVVVAGLHRWKPRLLGRTVRVEGTLVSSTYTDAPCPYEGVATCAMWGRTWRIRGATWTAGGEEQ